MCDLVIVGMDTSMTGLGWRGIVLLVVTGVVGLMLAVHGWSTRSGAALPGQLAGHGTGAGPGGAASPAPAPAPSTGHSPSHRIGPVASPAGTPSASPSPTSPSPTSSAITSVGPTLASQSYAQYSFQVWPGPRSAAANAAMAGLTVSVSRTSNGIQVVAGVIGQPPSPAQVYVGGTKVYIVEASLGDDSNNADYNLGDDGVIVTNAQGRILR